MPFYRRHHEKNLQRDYQTRLAVFILPSLSISLIYKVNNSG